MPRTEIVKQLWPYIRKNNLQDPSNKRKIICNDEQRLVFETDCIDIFQMKMLLAKHIMPPHPAKDPVQKSKKLKVEESEVKSAESNPVIISQALAKFFGTSGREVLQPVVHRCILDCIKVHNLEDSINEVVVCDAMLQELFGCDTIPSSGVYDIIAHTHFHIGPDWCSV